MSRLSRIVALVLAISAPPWGATAIAQTDACSEQLIRQVELRMPRLDPGLNIRSLSCAGITQIYFILNEDDPKMGQMLNQKAQIEAVFRREGLLN